MTHTPWAAWILFHGTQALLVALFVWTFSVDNAATIMFAPRMPYIFMFLALIYFIFWPFLHWSDRMERFIHVHSALQWFNFIVLVVSAWIFSSQILHCQDTGQSCSNSTQIGLLILEGLVMVFAFLYLCWSFCHSSYFKQLMVEYRTSYAGQGFPFAYNAGGYGYGYGYGGGGGGMAQQQQQQEEQNQDQGQAQGNQLGPTHITVQNSINNQPDLSQREGYINNTPVSDYSSYYQASGSNGNNAMESSLPNRTDAMAFSVPLTHSMSQPFTSAQSSSLLMQQQQQQPGIVHRNPVVNRKQSQKTIAPPTSNANLTSLSSQTSRDAFVMS